MGLSRTANLELITLPNCGGLRENGSCSWLDVPVCAGAKCHYCHNSENSMEKAHERLRSLDEETQRSIAQKYYGGTRPWMDADVKAQRSQTCSKSET